MSRSDRCAATGSTETLGAIETIGRRLAAADAAFTAIWDEKDRAGESRALEFERLEDELIDHIDRLQDQASFEVPRSLADVIVGVILLSQIESDLHLLDPDDAEHPRLRRRFHRIVTSLLPCLQKFGAVSVAELGAQGRVSRDGRDEWSKLKARYPAIVA